MKSNKTFGSCMTRRELLKHGFYAGLAAGLPASLWLAGCGEKQPEPGVKPASVILISLDTLRADFLGCYGYSRPTSPTLDKLASEGLLFEDVSTPSPWTLPAHVSLLTGLYPSRHGVDSIRTKIPAHIPRLASFLSQHGLATAAVVNYWLLRRSFGFGRGFDHFSLLHQNQEPPEGMASEVIDKATKWLLKHGHDPFFLFLHYFDLHSDYRSLPRYEEQFVRPYGGHLNGTTEQLMPFCPQFKEFVGKKGTVNRADANHVADLYAASIRQIDDELKKFLFFLQKQNLFDHTFLIVTSDHGEEFGEHGGFLHGYTQFQEAIHVPLIIHGPGLPKGHRIKEIASLVDVVPTILALLGIPQPTSLDGIDLRPLWQKSDTKPPERYIFAEADALAMDNPDHEKHNIKRAIRHPRYKLHYNLFTKEARLYDLFRDPQEKMDIAREHTPLFNILLKELKEFMKVRNTGEVHPPPMPEEIETLRSLGYL